MEEPDASAKNGTAQWLFGGRRGCGLVSPAGEAARPFTDRVRVRAAGLTALLVHGDRDDLVPLSQSTSYADRVHATGGSAELHVVAGMGHFEVIAPSHASWRHVTEGLARLTKDRPEM